jgi:SAM-dependent methyltransferase
MLRSSHSSGVVSERSAVNLTADKRTWENAEIARSDFEALHTPDARLRREGYHVDRYLNPPLDTVFPLEFAYAMLGDVRGRTVLDFGCGSGENALLLARRGARVVGVDISESLIRLARRRLEVNGCGADARFVVGSAHDLPVASCAIDVVFGIAILHHLDLDAASREVFRVLAPGGRAIFQEPVRDSTLLRAVRRMIPYRAPDVSPYERPLTSAELRRFAQPFTSMSVRAFSLPFVNVAQAVAPFRRYVMPAYRLDGALLRRAPALEWFSGVRVFTVTR